MKQIVPGMIETNEQANGAPTLQSAGFDPFRDRLSRDIRNSLCRAFGKSLEEKSLAPVDELCASLLRGNLRLGCRKYVESRLELYRRAFDRIQKSGGEPVLHGLILWDLRLFFEMHAVLEQAWHQSEGSLKKLLQALIRAAGVYIKLEHGFNQAAAGLAMKACAGLEENIDTLSEYFAPEELIAALKSLKPDPPLLLRKSLPAANGLHREARAAAIGSGQGDAE